MLRPVHSIPATAGLARRVAALAYDALLLIAIYAAITLVLVLAANLFGVSHSRVALQLALVLATGLFYSWFWRHGGQTLGMRAWRLRLVTNSGVPLSWRHVFVRLASSLLSLACLGLGYLWILFDRNRLAWHDYASGTRPVVIESQNKKAK